MTRVSFEGAAGWWAIAVLVAIGYAVLLYQAKQPWSVTVQRTLFAVRFLLVFVLCALFMGPAIRLVSTEQEKPLALFIIDDSQSMAASTDSTALYSLTSSIEGISERIRKQGFDSKVITLAGEAVSSLRFQAPASDLATSLQKAVARHEGKHLTHLALITDGIYNSGSSPLFLPLRQTLFTVGVGDTTDRPDLQIKNLIYNKLVYQGNRFPLRAEVLVKGYRAQTVRATVQYKGQTLTSLERTIDSPGLLTFDFQLDAPAAGLQRFEVVVQALPDERNTENNRTSAFVEVAEGKRKILLLAAAPHPDLKALQATLAQNPNYDVFVHIPEVVESSTDLPFELLVVHQPADLGGRLSSWQTRLQKKKIPTLFIIGSQSKLSELPQWGIPLEFESRTGFDQAQPALNAAFRDFMFDETVPATLRQLPPLQVPFGKIKYPAQSSILLFQQIGTITTDRPLLLVWEDGQGKSAAVMGEGLWRWRLQEFARLSSTRAFDEVFGKLFQYLAATDDKSRFRCFPVQTQFNANEGASFETQIYNSVLEPIFGQTIRLDVSSEDGRTFSFSFTNSPGAGRYRIATLDEGVYRYKATTELDGKTETATGQFLIARPNVEAQNLTADFNLLRNLATENGGRFFDASQLRDLEQALLADRPAALLRSESTTQPFIEIQWILLLVLALATAEWVVRKIMGSY